MRAWARRAARAAAGPRARSRAAARRAGRRGCRCHADVCASSAPRPANARCSTAARISTPSPRPCADAVSHEPVDTLRLPAKSSGADILRADDAALVDDRERQRPVLRGERAPHRPVEGEEALQRAGLLDPVGPGNPERHLTGGMDARARRLEELDEILVVRHPQLEPRRRDAQRRRAATGGCRDTGPASSRAYTRPPMAEDWFEVNRELWDERVPIHVASELYDVEAFVAGRSSLRPFELAELPDVEGRTLVHPQCHFGEDTLSWARLGARVTGLDFSGPAIEAARDLAARCAAGRRVRRGQRLRRRRGARRPSLRDRLHRPRRAQLAARRRALGARDGLAGRARRLPLPGRVPPVLARLRRRRLHGRVPLLPRRADRVPDHRHVRQRRCEDGAQPRVRVEPRPGRGRERDHRRRLRARVPARARLHAVRALAVPGRPSGDRSGCRRACRRCR